MNQLITVTGANGMLGSHVVRELLKRNYRVRGMVQPDTSLGSISDLDVEIAEADVTNTCDVLRAMAGTDGIIHTAASTSVWPYRNTAVYNVNLQGTANVLLAAMRYSVARLVHVSSANSFASGDLQNPGTEKNCFNGAKYGLDYIDSKYQAQQLAEKAAASGLDCVIVNPTFMLGAYDSGGGSGKLILSVAQNRLSAIPPGGRNFICAKDAAAGVVNALETGKRGESYILGNQNLSYHEIISKIAGLLNVKPPIWHVPPSLVKLAGRFEEWRCSRQGSQPQVSRIIAEISCETNYYSATKAVRELRLPQSPLEEGIIEAYEWFRKAGLITK